MEKSNKRMGKIFDIQRFSFHDGKGIRTNVFFKGCSLRCIWCHNPEGLASERKLQYFSSKCIECRLCVEASHKAISFDRDNRISIDQTKTRELENAVEACPTNALQFDCALWTVEELLEEVLRDKPFFEQDGGVTVSGGEPLLQWEFVREFLKRLKQEGVHTAIETALNVPQKNIEGVLEYVDQIYFDVKIFERKRHQQFIQMDNRQILENVKYILNSDDREKVTVRTPLIPGITDTEENIREIAKFISMCYAKVRYELLNYNPLAQNKYEKFGMEFLMPKETKPLSKKRVEFLRQVAKENGIRNIIGE